MARVSNWFSHYTIQSNFRLLVKVPDSMSPLPSSSSSGFGDWEVAESSCRTAASPSTPPSGTASVSCFSNFLAVYGFVNYLRFYAISYGSTVGTKTIFCPSTVILQLTATLR